MQTHTIKYVLYTMKFISCHVNETHSFDVIVVANDHGKLFGISSANCHAEQQSPEMKWKNLADIYEAFSYYLLYPQQLAKKIFQLISQFWKYCRISALTDSDWP